MSKRFTDTSKWDKAWFRALTPKLKATWGYLCDRCDHAGIWPIDMQLLSFYVGEEVTINEVVEFFGDRVDVVSENKLYLTGFVEFQYGELNPNHRVHRSILNKLSRSKIGLHNPINTLSKGLDKGKVTHKDKDKEKDKDKDKDKEKEKDKDKDPHHNAALKQELSFDTEALTEVAHYLKQIYGYEHPRSKSYALRILTAASGNMEMVRHQLDDIYSIPEVRGEGIPKSKRTAYVGKVLSDRFGL